MRPVKKRFCYFVCGLFAWGVTLAGCTLSTQVFTISAPAEPAPPPPYGRKDYPQALAAIASVMSRDFKLPIANVSVTVYPSKHSYEAGAVADALADREQLQQQLGPSATIPTEAEFIAARQRSAVSSVALGNYRRILIDDSRAVKSSWDEWVRLLAHELTHSAQRELISGRLSSSDQWLREGFAEWVGYQVADKFGAQSFTQSRQRALDAIATARSYQTFPSLSQLARNSDWTTWSRTLGRAGTYGQSLIAVDLLIEDKGVATVVNYFRLFGKSNNREKNFRIAFGETLANFEERFHRHLAVLIGR
jgi:hypothetical protein